MNRDGSNVRRLTNNPAIDIDADLVADRHPDRVHVRPVRLAADLHHRRRRLGTCSKMTSRVVLRPADVVAGAVQRDRVRVADRAGLRHQDLRPGHAASAGRSPSARAATRARRLANGRHIAFMSTRAGKKQIFTIGRDGKDLRQITTDGNNYTPDWSK